MVSDLPADYIFGVFCKHKIIINQYIVWYMVCVFCNTDYKYYLKRRVHMLKHIVHPYGKDEKKGSCVSGICDF